MKSYIIMVEVEKKPKTSVYEVRTKNDGFVLGIIKWYGPWRQYCFFPSEETLWSRGCLQEIIDFIEKIMSDRKA